MHTIYEFIRRRHAERTPNFPWHLDDKLAGKEFAKKHGVSIPETFQTIDSIDALADLRLRNRCVIKPSGLCSAMGVFALIAIEAQNAKNPRPTYLNWLSPRTVVSRKDVVEHQRHRWEESSYRKSSIVHRVIVEDLVPSPYGVLTLPLEVRCYYAGKRVRLVSVLNRNCTGAHRYRFFNECLDSAEQSIIFPRPKPRGESPERGQLEAIVSDAEKLGNLLGTPFVRIDFYASIAVPVFGEFTPAPGGGFEESLGLKPIFSFSHELLDSFWTDIQAELQ